MTVSPPETAPVCGGSQLELTCITTGSHLEWRFSVIFEHQTTTTDVSHIFLSSDSASTDAIYVIVNGQLYSVQFLQDICQRQFTSGVYITDWSC